MRPDGSYARGGSSTWGWSRLAKPAPCASTLILEWSRREDAVALRATVKAAGRLEVIGDAPWGWEGRWVAGGGGAEAAREAAEAAGGDAMWRARLKGAEIVAVFAAGTEAWQAPDPGRGEVARSLEVGDGEAAGVRMVAVWGGDGRGGAGPPPGWRGGRLDRNGKGRVATQSPPFHGPARAWSRASPTTSCGWCSCNRRPGGSTPPPAAAGSSRSPHGRETDPSAPDPDPDDWTVFGWDSFFNALLLATASGELAWSALLAGIESRYPNGNVPNWRSRRGGTPDRSQPPIGSYAALRLHELHPDLDALAAAYPGLLAWSDWWVADKNGRPAP